MNQCICKIVFFIIGIIAPFQTWAQAPLPSSINEKVEALWQKAQRQSPKWRQFQNQIKAGQAMAKQESYFSQNPEIFAAVNNAMLKDFPAIHDNMMGSYSLGISQKITLPWEALSRKNIAQNESLAMQQEVFDEQKQYRFFLEEKLYQVNFYRQKEDLLRQSKQALQDIIQTARAKVATNQMSIAMLLRAEADLTLLDNEINEVAIELQQNKSQLETLCNDKLDQKELYFQDDELLSILSPTTIEEFNTDYNAQAHPQYKKYQYKSLASQHRVANSKANVFGEIMLMAEYMSRRNSHSVSNEDMISVKVSAPLPVFYFNKDRHAIEKESRERDAAIALQEQVLFDLQRQRQSQLYSLKKLSENLRNFDHRIIPHYKAAYNSLLASLPAGNIALSEVIEAYRMYLQMQVERYKTAMQALTALAYINYLTHK